MLRRSFLQGFFSLALFPRKVLPRKKAVVCKYKRCTVYLNGKKMKLDDELSCEGYIPTRAEFEEIVLGRLDGYANTKFVEVVESAIHIRKV